MHKYLVQKVLQLIESDYGTIVVVKFDTEESWKIDLNFVNNLQEWGYKFSDDEKYKEQFTWENSL